jgi:hypothetical protein
MYVVHMSVHGDNRVHWYKLVPPAVKPHKSPRAVSPQLVRSLRTFLFVSTLGLSEVLKEPVRTHREGDFTFCGGACPIFAVQLVN